MAVNAIEVGAGRRTLWRYLVTASPERWEFSTRLALICALTTLVTEIYQTPEPALTAYIVFFLNRPERTMSLILSVALTLLITVVIAMIFLVAKVVTDDPLLRVLSIAALSFGLLFLASASKLRPVAGTIALIVGYALDLLGTIQVGELATRALFYAWLFVAIPAGVSLIINLAFAPVPRRVAERAIAQRLRQCARLLREPENPSVRQSFRECAQSGVADILEQLKLAGVEKSLSERDLGALQQATLSIAALVSVLEVFESNSQVQFSGETRHAIAETLDDMAQILKLGGYPVEVTTAWPAGGDVSPLAQQVLAEIRQAVTRFAEPTEAAKKAPQPSEGFLVKDAFTNPEHVHYALKTTAAAVFCYCLYSLLDWPGIHTCFLTCYIVAQSTAAESVEKLTLRIVGCLVGAAAGIAAIVFLVPSLTSIGGLLLAVFAGAWVAAYIAAGSPRVSYAGFQFAFAFFLCLIQGAGPQFDLAVARDRIIGILIGNLVAYIAFVHFWPMSICRRIDPTLVSVLNRLREIILADGSRDERVIAIEVNSTLAAVATDLALARYEPDSIGAPDNWISTRHEAIERSRSLCPLLLLGKDQDVVLRRLIGRRLTALSTNVAAHGSAKSDNLSAPHGSAPGLTITGLIEENLNQLEGALRSSMGNTEIVAHARP